MLHQVGNDPEGAVMNVREDRAHRLIRGGYAEALPTRRRKGKDDADAAAGTDHPDHDGTD